MPTKAVQPSPLSPGAASGSPTKAKCPFCTDAATTPLWHTQSEDGTAYHVHSCGNCGTGFLDPWPSDHQLAQAYATTYYGEGETKFNPYVERFRDVFSTLRARQLTRGLASGARIMDVGCGDGRLLRTLRRVGDFDLHGIELPGPAAERAAHTPGLNLHLGTLDTIDLPAATFDLITLVHVYEHLPAPREALDRLARLLRSGGRLFLSFPNISSWQARAFGGDWFHLDPPRHLTLVPPRTVTAHLESVGFRLTSQQHLCLEQNTYGWLQSVLNRCDGHRNFLYERLKRNRSYLPKRRGAAVALHAAAAGISLIPSLALDVASALVRAGATVELTFEKS